MSSPAAEVIETDSSSKRNKRTSNACKQCRERKVKCSGTHPCVTCVRRSASCIFETEDRRVTVSERYLAELKRKSAAVDEDVQTQPCKRIRNESLDNHGSQISAGRSVSFPPASPSIRLENQTASETTQVADDDGFENGDLIEDDSEGHSLAIMSNPLAIGPSESLRGYGGRRHFLGPSSTWAYSQQVMNMIKNHLGHNESPEVPFNTDGRAFTLSWPSAELIGPLRMDRLPSLDFALYLTNTVKFHLGQLYHLFHERTFMDGLYEFYNSGPQGEPIPKARLWYIHYLLIIAFGRALLHGCVDRRPAGAELASRAIELLPDTFGLYEDPILSIEILCCLALYLQSIDHRNSAFTYIGQAMRMALSQGLHRELFGHGLTEEDIGRHRAVWWTIYILDKRFSSLMGAPNSISDGDITVPLPDSGRNTHNAKALSLHVALSRLQAKVLNAVYGQDGKLGVYYLKNTTEALRDMAGLASEFHGMFEFQFDNSGPTSRVSATLNLYYHQCIVLATRPLLMCLLQQLFNRRASNLPDRDITEPVRALLKTSQESAAKSLRILLALDSQNLLETFLPFDLDSTFSCAFVLSLMASIPACPLKDTTEADASFYLLNKMITRGNTVAEYRKAELERLYDFLQLLRVELSSPAPPRTCSDHRTLNVPSLNSGTSRAQLEHQDQLPQEAIDTVNGLSPDHMLSLAGLLEWNSANVDWLWVANPDVNNSDGALIYGAGTDE
ncbi:fungal-specific transcription factor domain-containing protein [Hypomontagnella monticulosa]|nr:fungal-specific transcription factor domain-containing protein [Hypomontagnella monticulosa]